MRHAVEGGCGVASRHAFPCTGIIQEYLASLGKRPLKILFITATRIGDAVLSSGLIAYLAAEYPAARFTVVCGAPAAPVFEAKPRHDRLIVIEKKPFHLHLL